MPVNKKLLAAATARINSYRDDMVAFQKELTAIVARSTASETTAFSE